MKYKKQIGIDLSQFKKFIEEEIGNNDCKEYSFDCLNCFAWDVYKKLEAFLWYVDLLENLNIDKKQIRKHNKKIEDFNLIK
jgi:hypothetical protein